MLLQIEEQDALDRALAAGDQAELASMCGQEAACRDDSSQVSGSFPSYRYQYGGDGMLIM